MKESLLALAAILLLAIFHCAAYGMTVLSDNTRGEKGARFSGKVSSNGKVFMTDGEDSWTISNVEAINGYEGKYITVSCCIDQNHHAIRVISVITETLGARHSNSADMAFYR